MPQIPKLGSIIPNMGNNARPAEPASVAEALFTKVQQRVLSLLFTNPERSYFGSEIIRLADSGSGAVQRELARLESAGLVSVERLGRQRHYRANPAAPVFHELRSLIVKTSGLADPLRSALAPRLAEIRLAFVYGSVAKGGDRAASDIDLLVVSDTLAHAELFTLLEPASLTLGRPVNPTLYSLDELGERIQRRNAFITRVMEQPKIWVIGGDDDLPS